MRYIYDCSFKIGDIVRLKTGKSPQKVVNTRKAITFPGWELECIYLSNLMSDYESRTQWRPENGFVIYREEPVQQLPEEKEMSDLYQVKKAIERFGVFLTRNSAGHMVLEMKGENGKVEAFPEEELELFTPYTVRLRRIGTYDGSVDLVAEKGAFKQNDILMEVTGGNLFRVADLDTKVRGAQSGLKLKFVRLQTEEVKFGLSE